MFVAVVVVAAVGVVAFVVVAAVVVGAAVVVVKSVLAVAVVAGSGFAASPPFLPKIFGKSSAFGQKFLVRVADVVVEVVAMVVPWGQNMFRKKSCDIRP